jgi:radical SAM superfamily enzyme YgiQ (UPF0313 family)
MNIGYFSFGKAEHNYGLANCLYFAKRHGFQAKLIKAAEAKHCDVVLLSCYWWEHFYDLIRFISDAQIDPKKEKPFVLVGGFQVSQNPMPLDPFVTAGFIGDGEEALTEILLAFRKDGVCLDSIRAIPGVYVPGCRDPIDYRSMEKLRVPIYDEDHTSKVRRVEITRGCKFKCGFCALAFLKPYRETPIEQINEALYRSDLRNVALFGPERTNHSRYEDIEGLVQKYGKNNLASDIRLESIKKVKSVSNIRFGLEGLSYRLRKLVGKNFTDEKVVEGISAMRSLKYGRQLKKNPVPGQSAPREGDHGHGSCLMYLILDLPSETHEDYLAFTGLMEKLESIPDAETFTLFPSPNVFIPTPHTPMQWFGINPFGQHRKWWREAMRGPNNDRLWKFKVAMRDTAFSASKRIKTMLAVRGDERAAKVMWNLVTNRPLAIGLKKLSRENEAIEIVKLAARAGIKEEELIGDYSTSAPLPWSFIKTYFMKDGQTYLLRYYEMMQERIAKAKNSSFEDLAFMPDEKTECQIDLAG